MDKEARPWVWDGGRPCLDLVNTYRDRKGGGWELLREPDDLAAWLLAAGLTQHAGPTHRTVVAQHATRVGPARLAQARELREAVSRCLDAVLAGRACPRADLAVVNRWAARHASARAILRQPRTGPPVLVVPPPGDPVAAALAGLAADAVRLLGADDRALVRVCASDTCGLRFLDRSAAGSRQWCAMSRCGNRAKARTHRKRAHGGDVAGGGLLTR
jgi:predicted RNA-binding Zn ribbon-like protein